VNHIISKLAQKVRSSDTDKQRLDKYLQMQKAQGWEIHQEYLLTVRGLMAEDMLSDRFTVLTPLEKDTCQRAYSMLDQMIIFLLDPLVRARKLDAIAAHNLRQEATVKGATERGNK
jgi:hypothetical protein